MSKMELTTTEDVMHALGGTRAVAELTGRKYTAAAHWFKFSCFPANTFLLISAALEERGYSAPPSLWGIPVPEKSAAQ
jgi:hypothetical protein